MLRCARPSQCTTFYDRLENRTPAARESALIRDLNARHLGMSKSRAPALRAQVKGLEPWTSCGRASISRGFRYDAVGRSSRLAGRERAVRRICRDTPGGVSRTSSSGPGLTASPAWVATPEIGGAWRGLSTRRGLRKGSLDAQYAMSRTISCRYGHMVGVGRARDRVPRPSRPATPRSMRDIVDAATRSLGPIVLLRLRLRRLRQRVLDQIRKPIRVAKRSA